MEKNTISTISRILNSIFSIKLALDQDKYRLYRYFHNYYMNPQDICMNKKNNVEIHVQLKDKNETS